MKNFDIDSIGREMPYKTPNSEFFDRFEENLFNKIEKRNKKSRLYRRVIAPISAAAAVILLCLSIYNITAPDIDRNNMLGDNLEDNIDMFISGLSDAELESIAVIVNSQEEFYNNISIN